MEIVRKAIAVLTGALLCFGYSYAREWQTDILGEPFEMTYVGQGEDYAGPVRSTVVRLRSDCREGARRSVLYVHGYNDYFFQDEMANTLADACWNFYAVDLRRYGRSLQQGDKRFQVRDMREYFADIDSALKIMKEDGIEEVALMGHSTGGLTTSLYMSEHPDTIVKALILNSPFLDWNQSGINRNILIPAMDGVGKLFPEMEFSQGDNTSYSESLLADCHGEWKYNTDWKLIHSQPVEASWLRAIDSAQAALTSRTAPITVPVLLMHSDRSSHPSEWNEECNRTDIVLNVDDIKRIGRGLGTNVTEATVRGGMHDLMLSSRPVREAAQGAVLSWLDKVMPNYRTYRSLYY